MDINQDKKDNSKLEDVLRSRLFWIVVPFLLIYLSTAIAVGSTDREWLTIYLPLFGAFLLPTRFIEGISPTLLGIFYFPFSDYHYLFPIVFYGLFITFIVLLKKFTKKTLYRLSILILIVVLLTIKGCVTADYSM